MEGKGRRFRGRVYPWGVVEGITHKVMVFKAFSSFILVSFHWGINYFGGIVRCNVNHIITF